MKSYETNTSILDRLRSKGPSIRDATTTNSDEMPEEMKPSVFPFDYAWESSKIKKRSSSSSTVSNVKVKDETPEPAQQTDMHHTNKVNKCTEESVKV